MVLDLPYLLRLPAQQFIGDQRMNGWKTKSIVTVLAATAVALFATGTADLLALSARVFCFASTAIFAIASSFGLASRLRA
jgi:hypothetical protein